MTDEETKFVETLMRQIETASQEKREVLGQKLVQLDQRLRDEDLHISDLIETVIDRTRKRENDMIEQLEELRSLVSHRVQVAPPPLPLADQATTEMANRFASKPQDSVRQVVNDSFQWAN